MKEQEISNAHRYHTTLNRDTRATLPTTDGRKHYVTTRVFQTGQTIRRSPMCHYDEDDGVYEEKAKIYRSGEDGVMKIRRSSSRRTRMRMNSAGYLRPSESSHIAIRYRQSPRSSAGVR